MYRWSRLFLMFFSALPILLMGCGRTADSSQGGELDKERRLYIEELNRRNMVGFLEYCARKSYVDQKPLAVQKARFKSHFAPNYLKLAQNAYTKGRSGEFLQFILPKKSSDQNSSSPPPAPAVDYGGEKAASIVVYTASVDSLMQEQATYSEKVIHVRFSGSEVSNGELAAFCQRNWKYASEGLGVFAPDKPVPSKVPDDHLTIRDRD